MAFRTLSELRRKRAGSAVYRGNTETSSETRTAKHGPPGDVEELKKLLAAAQKRAELAEVKNAQLQEQLSLAHDRADQAERSPLEMPPVSQQPLSSMARHVTELMVASSEAQSTEPSPSVDQPANNESSALSAKQLHDKFSTSGDNFVFHFGDDSVFHMGLEGLIGSPSPEIHQAIAHEHASDEPFDSHNVRNTTPVAEWRYVVHGTVGERPERKESEERAGWTLERFTKDRRCRQAKLTEEEVVGVRLYTGPMYVQYNERVLRKRIQGEYVTTIHVINSAIVKLSRHQKACVVYRGVRGGVLPNEFWQANEHGVMGGVELGLMSTTTDRNVAMEFARTESGKCSMVLEIRMGMVDRGADVSFLSQFPLEKEILFGPLTGLEVVSAPRIENDRVIVVELRLSTNQRSQPIEQVISKLKTSHVDLVNLIFERFNANGVPAKMLAPLEHLRLRSEARDGAWFNTAVNFEAATREVFEARERVFEALRERPGEKGLQCARAAELCAREGQFEAVMRLLGRACRDEGEEDTKTGATAGTPASTAGTTGASGRTCGTSAAGGKDGHGRGDYVDSSGLVGAAAELRVARWIISHDLRPPWPAAFSYLCRCLSDESWDELGPEIERLAARDCVVVGKQVVAFDGRVFRWRHGVVQEIAIANDQTEAASVMEENGKHTDKEKGKVVVDAGEKGRSKHGRRGRRSEEVVGKDEKEGREMEREKGDVKEGLKQTRDEGSKSQTAGTEGVRVEDADTITVLAEGYDLLTVSADNVCIVSESGVGAALRAASAAGSDSVVRALLANGASTCITDAGLNSALHLAAESGHAHVCELLIEAGATRRSFNGKIKCAADLARAQQHMHVLRVLEPTISDFEFRRTFRARDLKRSRAEMFKMASALASSRRSQLFKSARSWRDFDHFRDLPILHAAEGQGSITLLMAAARFDDHETAIEILEAARQGGQLEQQLDQQSESGCTALYLASEAGHERMVRALITAKARVDLVDKEGHGCLHRACLFGHEECVRLLVSHGAAVDAVSKDGSSSLMAACCNGHAECARVLVEEALARVDRLTTAGWSALMLASVHGYDECARVLTGAGADASVAGHAGWTSLMYACKNGHATCASVLLSAGAEPDALEKDGRSALMYACLNGHEACVRVLVGAAAAMETADNLGRTSLMFAAKNGHDECVRVLLGAQAAVDTKMPDGWTALMFACQNGHEACARVLVEAGAKVAAANSQGWTSLAYACQNGHEGCANLLIDAGSPLETLAVAATHGAEATQVTDQRGLAFAPGSSALSIARACGHETICRMLEAAIRHRASS